MTPAGESHLVCFYEHPKLVSLESGQVNARWDDLDSGTQQSSILLDHMQLSPLAIDAENRRFAFYGLGNITIIPIDPSE